MSTTRTVAQVETATTEYVGANKVKRALPTRNLKQVDPFLFIDHMVPTVIEPGADIRIPPHPHAGFEVVTYIIDGEFFHRDSKGHDQVAGAGDLNWMTSGSGIIHSEGPTADFLSKGGKLELIQVWINLPSHFKTVDASFRHYKSAVLPVIKTDNSEVKIILGEYAGKTSPVITQTPMYYYHIKLKAGSLFTLPVADRNTAAIYVMNGKLKVLNEEAKEGQLINFEDNGNQLVFSAITDAGLIAFGGEPIKEKVVSYGPFVMNSFEEIQQAIGNYETGKMGALDF